MEEVKVSFGQSKFFTIFRKETNKLMKLPIKMINVSQRARGRYSLKHKYIISHYFYGCLIRLKNYNA